MEIISLGGTCCIAYQLRFLGLREKAYPFDWVRINNLATITELIKNNFNNFLDKNKFIFNSVSDRFDVDGKMLSYVYDNSYCKFYHEFKEYINNDNFELFSQKYQRRINRFIQTIRNSNKILFIREEIGNLSINKIKEFSNMINDINPKLDWKMKIIVRNKKYLQFKSENIDIILSDLKINNWKRDELDWNSIFF